MVCRVDCVIYLFFSSPHPYIFLLGLSTACNSFALANSSALLAWFMMFWVMLWVVGGDRFCDETYEGARFVSWEFPRGDDCKLMV